MLERMLVFALIQVGYRYKFDRRKAYISSLLDALHQVRGRHKGMPKNNSCNQYIYHSQQAQYHLQRAYSSLQSGKQERRADPRNAGKIWENALSGY